MRPPRPCATCRHLDGEELPSGVAYCWALAVWRGPAEQPDCGRGEPADGRDPPGKVWAMSQRSPT